MVSLSTHHGVESVLPSGELFWVCAFYASPIYSWPLCANMTSSTTPEAYKRIAKPLEEDRVTATADVQNFGLDQTCGS